MTRNEIDAAIGTTINNDPDKFLNWCGDGWRTYYSGFSLSDFVERLLPALAAQQDGAWQPIETAPRQTRVLVCDVEGEVFVAQHGNELGAECWLDDTWDVPDLDLRLWQPLPAGPEQKDTRKIIKAGELTEEERDLIKQAKVRDPEQNRNTS